MAGAEKAETPEEDEQDEEHVKQNEKSKFCGLEQLTSQHLELWRCKASSGHCKPHGRQSNVQGQVLGWVLSGLVWFMIAAVAAWHQQS